MDKGKISPMRSARPSVIFLRFTFFILLITSCSPSSPPQTAPSATAAPAAATLVIPTPIPLPTVTSSPIVPTPRPQYTFFVTLDYRHKKLAVDETIVYPNTTGETLHDLVLAVMPNIWEAVFKLNKLTVDGAVYQNDELDGQRLTLVLAQPLAPGQTIQLGLNYNLTLPQIDPNLNTTKIQPQFFGYTDRQMNLVNWYPFIVPRVANQWVLHDPWYFGEHLVYGVADFEVNIKNAEEGIVPTIAASGAPEPNGEWARYKLEDGRTFAFSASTEFKRSLTNAGNVFIYSYYFPLNEAAGKAAADAAADAIQVFTQRFGPYPHPTLTIVMSDFNDGAEFSAFFFLANNFYRTYDSTRANYLTFISAHETAHQWWFEQVANDQYLEPWLDEAMATYSEHIFYEDTDAAFVQWWWEHRVEAYTPHGFVDTPLDTKFEKDMYRQYVNAVYLRGALFLEGLRTRIGDEAFFAFLQDYLAQERGKIATTDDFFRILRQHTNANISDIVSEYFQTPH